MALELLVIGWPWSAELGVLLHGDADDGAQDKYKRKSTTGTQAAIDSIDLINRIS